MYCQKRSCVLFFALGCCILFGQAALAQYAIPAAVVANGASAMTGPEYRITGTLGQPVIGRAAGNYVSLAGFWYQATAATATGVEGGVDPLLPAVFALEQNHPNPFNPATQIRFALPRASRVDIRIYNINGALVETLTAGDYPAGEHTVAWNAAAYASGSYLVSMEAAGFSEVRKAVLIK